MIESAPGGYKEKYFQALKDQERLEKQTALQNDLLKRTMLQLATAASGMDQQLDASVLRLRELMRGGSGSQVVEQMERIQASVELFERSRIQENTKAAKNVGILIDQYNALQLPKNIKASLEGFKKTLQKRLSNFRQYPAVLEDLAKLQMLALESASKPEAGLWQRIRGGKTLKGLGDESAEIAVTKGKSKSKDELSAKELALDEPDAELSLEQSSQKQLRNLTRSLAEADEDSYEQVAGRIAKTLSNLVDKIEPNDMIKNRVDIVRLRIDRGMDWFVLAVTLEDIRDILFLRYLHADEEFSVYLNQVRSELGSIRSALSGAVERDNEAVQAATAFTDCVSSGVDKIRTSVQEAKQVDTLKQEVTDHITYIADALKTYQGHAPEPLTNQLQKLVEQVQTIEQESEKTKEALEQQRYKATHDTLTELPNREAYAERVFQEHQRFTRYKRPLTLCICDIDKFKNINDTFGHQAGDKVLKLIAKVVSTRLRNVDFIARFGGEEFVILMPETEAKQAFTVLDKVRAAVGKTPFRFKEKPVQITISFGISEFNKDESIESAFERADKALYKAKETGRNKCIIAD